MSTVNLHRQDYPYVKYPSEPFISPELEEMKKALLGSPVTPLRWLPIDEKCRGCGEPLYSPNMWTSSSAGGDAPKQCLNFVCRPVQ